MQYFVEILVPVAKIIANGHWRSLEINSRLISQGLRKPLFCVLNDELFTPEDELSWADGQK